MSTLSIAIVMAFVIGYLFIAIESVTKINKAAIALLMFVVCWTIFMIDPASLVPALASVDHSQMTNAVSKIIEEHLGETGTTLFFLMGAMTIVELVDQNGGFNFVKDTLKTKSKRSLLWRIAIMTFILSAILDNLTTSIVMIMILRKLVKERKDRVIRFSRHHCSQLWWCILAYWRRNNHHALEQGRYHSSWCYHRSADTCYHLYGHPCLRSFIKP